MPRWKKYSLITVAVVLGLMLLSMLVVPWQIKKQGGLWFTENTSRTLSIEKAFFNPFTLTVEIEGVRLSEQKSQRPFVSFRRLMLSGSLSSLFDLAVILDRVEIDEPFVNIELLGKQEFNFSDFTRLGENDAKTEEVPGNPIHFSFNNIVIKDGKIDFTDQTSAKKSQHLIRELSLSVPFIGNIPYLTDTYVEPQMRMLLNGSEIRINGQLKPFADSLETSITLLLDEIDLAFYAFHSPIPLPIEIKSGILDTQIDLFYRVSSSAQPKLLLGGDLALSDIDVRELDGSKLFSMPTLILDLDWADLMQQDINLRSVDIYEPQLYLNRNHLGEWNFQRILPAPVDAPSDESTTENQTSSLPLLKLEKFQLIDGKFHFQDDFVPGGFKEQVNSINLSLTEASTLQEAKTGLVLKLQTERGLKTEVQGEFGITPQTASLNLLLNNIPLKPYYPYLAPFITAPAEGTLNLASTIKYTADANLQLQQIQLGLHKLRLPFTQEDRFTLNDLALTGGRFDLHQQTLSFEEFKLSGGKLSARRMADGSLSPLKFIKEQQKAPATAVPQESAEPWRVNLGRLTLEQFELQLTDASLAKKPQLKIDQLALEIADLAYPKSRQSPFRFSSRINDTGAFNITGKLAHTPLRLQAKTQIKALSLADFNDFLPDNVKVSLREGRLSTALAITLSETPKELTGSFSGRANISRFNLRDPLNNGELLTWANLGLEGIKGEISPFSLQIKEVALSQYLANILIDQNGKINLTSVTTENSAPIAGEETTAPVPEPEVAADKSTPPPDIRIDALTLQGGTVSFTDRHLPSTFATTMYELGGRVTGMASAEEMMADVDLRGQLENHSPLSISGKINPLSKDLFTDLTINFADIDLAPMTPYSGTYLGYVIDKGKLYLDLNYHIEHQQIEAQNKVMIDQFTFGDKVKSDQATSLPVGLAIALLKDQKGEIHLDVPISGNLNDPSFSVAGTVFTILKNLLVKAATSPFSLLASMLGGGGEDFSQISFLPGVAVLTTVDQELIAKLAKMLTERPSLKLEISAFIDPEEDPEGYRQNQLNQLVDAEWQRQVKPLAEQVITAEEYSDNLWRVYKQAKFPKPRNAIGMQKKLPPVELEKLLLANMRVGDEELNGLAKARAAAVQEELVLKSPDLKPRIFLKNSDIRTPPQSNKKPARVEFGILAN